MKRTAGRTTLVVLPGATIKNLFLLTSSLSVLFIFFTLGFGQDALEYFKKAQEFQKEGNYTQALKFYSWLADDAGCLNVHSKVLVIDDRLALVGSANLSDRSMGLDTELCLAIEANGDGNVRSAIAAFRNRLLAEHLDTDPSTVRTAHERHGRLLATIAALARPGARTLAVLDPPLDPAQDAIVPDHALLDPEKPIDPDELVGDLVPEPATREVTRVRAGLLAAVVLAIAAAALAWRHVPSIFVSMYDGCIPSFNLLLLKK